MNPIDVIEAYVADVIRRVPRQGRDEIGFELRGLLVEMLDDRALIEERSVDDAMVLAMLEDFGTPAEIAVRYHPPGTIIIPAEQTQTFALLAVGGVAVQWALTLPVVFNGEPPAVWWMTWGLGSLWWPGFMVMAAMISAWFRRTPGAPSNARPRVFDSERIDKRLWFFGLAFFAIAMLAMVSLPWIVRSIPDPVSQIFAFDTDFLRYRALWVVLLWLGAFAIRTAVFSQGRWSPRTRRWDALVSVGFFILLAWWILAGDIFQTGSTDRSAKAAIGLVMACIVFDLGYKLYRRMRIRAPNVSP